MRITIFKMNIYQSPFEIQLNGTTRFEGMIKEKNIHFIIQR